MRATTTTPSKTQIARAVGAAFHLLDHTTAKSATKYLSDGAVVRVTRVGRRKTHARSRSTSVVVTTGKPNYRDRRFLAACKRAGEPLPIKKIQLRGTW